MSCGKRHETPCTDVLDAVSRYLDAECDPVDTKRIKQHLSECGECLREYGIEQEVKALVGRCCGASAPDGLEDRLRAKLTALKTTQDAGA